jgi:hypothetical protein
MSSVKTTLLKDHRSWFALLVAILSITLFYPLGNDNALYQSITNDLVYHGRVMYVGSWDHNFPGIILFHLPSTLLFGNSEIGFRAFDLLFQLCACAMLFRLWSLWMKPEVAFMSVLFYVFAYIRGSVDTLGQRDVFGGILILAAFYLILRQSSTERKLPPRDLVAPGLLIGLAAVIRPTFVVYACIALVTLSSIRSIKHAIVLLGVSALPLAVVIAGYAAAGHLDDFYLATVRFNADLYTTFSAGFDQFLMFTLYYQVPIVIMSLMGLIILWRSKDRGRYFWKLPSKEVNWLWGISGVVTLALVVVQKKYLSYHFVPLYLFCAPMAAIAVACLTQRLPERLRLTLFILLGVFAAYPKKSIANVVKVMMDGNDRTTALDAFRSILSYRPLLGYEDEQAALAYLERPENMTERIELIGFHHILKAHLGRASATRFNQLNSIGYKHDTSRHFDESQFTPYQQRWRREYIDSLTSARPALIVVVRTSDSWYLKDPYKDVLHELPGYDSLMRSAYQMDTVIGGYEIYRRRIL